MMTGNTLTLVCVREPADPFLDCDIGGCSVRTEIADRHAQLFGADVHFVPGAAPAASLNELTGSAGDLLIVDGRAWFPAGVTKDTWQKAANGSQAFRVVAQDPSLEFAPDTLAVGLNLRDLTGETDLLSAPLHQACAQILDRATSVASAPIVRSPGLLVDGYGAVARCEASLMGERATAAMSKGVRLRNPARVYIRGSLLCGANVTIDTDVIFDGNVTLGDDVRVDAHCIVSRSRIGAKTWVKPFSLVEDAEIGSDCRIGPYARVRPASRIGDQCQIGNFVETKSSTIGAGSRINHHTFIGDAVLGDRVTIGAGTITCNHDGTKTNQTIIGPDAYIGSGCKLVAPLRIGDAATIGAGSTITEDVPGATLTLARARQVTVRNWSGPRAGRGDR